MTKVLQTVNPVYGFKVNYYEDDRYIGQHTQKNGIESEETKLFQSLITDNTLVLDVGANLGWYSLVFAQTCRNKGWHGTSIAFEPASSNIDILESNVSDNKFEEYIIVEPLAIGDENTSMKLWLSLFEDKWINRGDHRLNRGNREHFDLVDVVTLDSYMGKNGLLDWTNEGHLAAYKNFILKVDVQGFEYKVLKGAVECLQNLAPLHLLIEFNRGTGVEHFDFIKKHFNKVQILGGGEATSFKDIDDFCNNHKHTHANLYAVKE